MRVSMQCGLWRALVAEEADDYSFYKGGLEEAMSTAAKRAVEN